MSSFTPHIFEEARWLSAGGTSEGGSVYFYYSGTTNLAPVYQDKNLSVLHPNPLTVAVGAILPQVFLDPEISYRRRVVFTDGSVFDRDPVNVSTTPENISVKDYGALGDGSVATAAFQAALAAAISAGSNKVFVPAGHYKVSNLAVNASGVSFEGEGISSRISQAVANTAIFVITSSDVSIKNLKLEGDGTTSASNNGIGILGGNCARLTVSDVWFDNFGFGGINVGFTNLLRGPKIYRTRHTNTRAGGVEIYLRGLFDGVKIEDTDAVTSLADWGVFVFDEGSVGQRALEINNGFFDGYKRYNIGVSDENPNGEDRGFSVKIAGGHHKNAGLGAIKVKNYRGVLIQGVTTDNCGITPITGISDSGEDGTFYINSAGLVEVASCKLRDNGMGGITVSQGAPTPFTRADGLARNQYNVHDNQIDGCGIISYPGTGSGIRVSSGVHQAIVSNNSIRGVPRFCLEIGNDPVNYSETVSVIGNDFSQNLACQQAIYARYVRTLKMDMNEVRNSGIISAYILNVDTVYSGAGDRFVDSLGGGYNIRLDDCKNITLLGDYSCTDYATWTTGQVVVPGDKRYNGVNVYVSETGGTCGGSAPVHTSGSVSDGGVVWTFWGKYRAAASAICLRGAAASLLRMGNTSKTNSTQTAHGIDFSPFPARWEWVNIDQGVSTLASGTAVVNLFDDRRQVDNNFKVLLTPNVSETVFVSAKTANTFTITSSNASSTAQVYWSIFR
jgi:hypothetical protein